MSGAFEAAWALLKADVYMAPDSSTRGFFVPDIGDFQNELMSRNKQMYDPKQAFIAGRQIPNPADVHRYREEGERQHAGIGGGDFGLASTKNVDYFRGGSMPRPNEGGGFVGVNVASDSFDWENDFEQAAQKFGTTAAHENIHDLINDDINEWAKQQSGYGQLQPLLSAMRAERMADAEGLERIRRGKMLSEETGTPYAELRDLTRGRQHNMERLRELGHEYGAFSGMRPDVTQEEVYNRMLNYNDINPYVHYSMLQQMPNLAAGFAGDPGLDPAHLHTGDPSIYNTATPL